MKATRNILIISSIICVCIFLTGSVCSASSEILNKKNLNRWVDPVIMEGKIAGEVTGAPLSNIRLYAYKNGKFEPIRFQVDEMTQDGDWIFTEGPIPNAELSNGKFDAWDMLIFMADDSGDRVSKGVWTPGYTKGSEIEVIDPITGEKGWCYLLYFASNPPPRSSLPAYIQYDYDTELIQTEYKWNQYMITEDGLHTTFYDGGAPVKKSITDELKADLVDRLKIRIRFKLLFGGVTLRFNEELLKSDVLAYKVDAVRLNRRLEQYVHIPGGIKALRVVADVIEYRNMCTAPVIANIPFKLNTFTTSAVVRFGTDYAPDVVKLGAKLYNSNNPQGFVVDGKMDDGEKIFNPKADDWRLITAKYGELTGTFMTRTVLSPEIKKDLKITMGLIDDDTYIDPPETYPGALGFMWQDWDVTNLKRGTYHLYLEFYFPPNYKPGDEAKYVNYLDKPLKIRGGNQEVESQPMLVTNLGKLYKDSYPKKPKKTKKD
jgi:hypothetical protein